MKFRKKPVVIEARQLTRENGEELAAWSGGKWTSLYGRGDRGEDISHVVIPTLEGNHRADLGDWVIQGVKGEFYPCKPEIFEATYDPVTDGEWRLNAERRERDERILHVLDKVKGTIDQRSSMNDTVGIVGGHPEVTNEPKTQPVRFGDDLTQPFTGTSCAAVENSVGEGSVASEPGYPDWLKKDLEHFRFEYSMGDLGERDLGTIEEWARTLASNPAPKAPAEAVDRETLLSDAAKFLDNRLTGSQALIGISVMADFALKHGGDHAQRAERERFYEQLLDIYESGSSQKFEIWFENEFHQEVYSGLSGKGLEGTK